MSATLRMRPVAGVLLGCAVALAGCAPLRGYPSDMENSGEVLASLKPYFGADKERAYAEAEDAKKRGLRNEIVLARMRAFDIEFDDFQERLFGDGNVVGVGGGLVALVLAGLGATTGHAGTASALAVSAAGLAGGQALISKDLFYQRTVPALIAQMQANRAKAKRPLLSGLRQSVDDYPLEQALADLQVLKTAGSIPAAVSNLTQQAQAEKEFADKQVEAVRTLDYSASQAGARLRAWLRPGGSLNPERRDALRKWMDTDPQVPGLRGMPLGTFLNGDDPLLESARLRAVQRLNVPPL